MGPIRGPTNKLDRTLHEAPAQDEVGNVVLVPGGGGAINMSLLDGEAMHLVQEVRTLVEEEFLQHHRPYSIPAHAVHVR